jgi:Cu+-exporting ATPase
MGDRVKDLVCEMDVDSERSASTMNYKDETYYFCSQGCKEQFAQNPKKYVRAKEQRKHAGKKHFRK